MAMTFVVCVEKEDLGDFSTEDIIVGKVYEAIDSDAGNDMIRIIDESGEDYLYPVAWFEPVAIGEPASMRLHCALVKAG